MRSISLLSNLLRISFLNSSSIFNQYLTQLCSPGKIVYFVCIVLTIVSKRIVSSLLLLFAPLFCVGSYLGIDYCLIKSCVGILKIEMEADAGTAAAFRREAHGRMFTAEH